MIKHIISFFTGKVGMYVGIAAFAASMFFGWLYIHDKSVETLALMKHNQQQLELVVREQQKFQTQLQDIKNLSDNMVTVLVEQNRKLDNEYSDIADRVKILPGADKESSDILKGTIKELAR